VGYGESLLKQGKREFMSANSSDFHWILDNGLDIFRSIWDKRNSVCVLDIEYFNIDYPGEVYFNPERTFNKLEPLYKTIKKIYNEYDIPYLCIMTGQGYHFSSAISNFSKSLKLLEEIGNVCPTLAGKYANPHGKMKRKVSYLHGKSFDGTGRLMEYLTHKIIKETNEISEIPVVFSDIPVGQKKEIGREAISIDLTAFADPLYMRDVRCPFSTHQKHKVQKHKVGDYIASHIPVQISLPRPDNIELKDLKLLTVRFL
jgi:hypothetical protein